MKIVITIGVPMSGKNYYAKQRKKELGDNWVIIEADEIRKMLTGKSNKYQAFNINNEKLVWDIINYSVEAALLNYKNIILSNTNTNLKILKDFIDTHLQYKLEFVHINTPVKICIERLNDNSLHMIEIIKRMEEQKKNTLGYLKGKGFDIIEIK